MGLKDNYDAMFHHYILDGARRSRELKYALGMAVITLIFFYWVWTVYQDPPMDLIGSIPAIVFKIIISQAAFYFIYTCYIGSKVVDIETDRKEDLLDATAQGRM